VELIRIVLVDMPPLLRDIVRDSVAGERDLDVVADVRGDAALESALDRLRPDLVILGAGAPQDVAASLVEGARVRRALALDEEGQGVLYELRPQRVRLGEISKDALLRTIRTVATWEDRCRQP
jgi:DNA-binding NarL/FixJ family response regulator